MFDAFSGRLEAHELETFLATGTPPTGALPNLTRIQQAGSRLRHNLSGAHPHQWQDAEQQRIVQRLSDTFTRSELGSQQDIEADFQHTFFTVSGQHSMTTSPHRLLTGAASLSIDLVATYLAKRGMSAGLIRPCIDAQAAILRSRGVRLIAVDETMLSGHRFGDTLRNLLERGDRPDALFLTLPNNPTGFTLSRSDFELLARACKTAGTLLIIDWAFRFYETYDAWDQYAILHRTGVDYLCIEDTGKTWPTLGLKCSALVTSPHLFPDMRELHNNIMLEVSPFVLRLLTAYLRDSHERGLDTTVRELIRINRGELQQALCGSVLAPAATDRAVSVEWVRICCADLSALDLVAMAEEIGIAILPGNHFYWDDHHAGSSYVRFALARDFADFALACRLLRRLIDHTPQLRMAGAA